MYTLRTLGGFSLESAVDGAPLLANNRKALALLAILAASRSAVSRDRLMGLLWSESDDARARGSLKQLLHFIRRQLNRDDVIEGLADLRLNSGLVASDVSQFHGAIASGDDHLAVLLYTGPFLDAVFIEGGDEFERFATAERNELARQFAGALERMALAATESGIAHEAVAHWRRLQEADPTNGRIAVELMRALEKFGDRAGAIRHARLHESLLREELGAPPEQRVVDYAKELLRAPEISRQSQSNGGSTPVALSVPDVVAPNGKREIPATESDGAEAFELALEPVISFENDSQIERPPATKATTNTATNTAKNTTKNTTTHALAHGTTITVALAVAATLVIVAAAGWYYKSRAATLAEQSSATPHPLQAGRVAVAVLANRTNDPKLDAIGIMASDWLTRGLSRVPGVDVIEAGGLYLRGRSNTGAVVDPIEMARQNGAAVVVAGGFYYRNAKRDSITFSLQVINVASGRVERALEPVSAATGEPVAALDEMRQRISSALGTLLDSRTPILNTPLLQPPKFDAYTEFLAGQEAYWKGDWEASLPYFRRAVSRDSTFYTAAAYVSIAAVGTGRCAVVDSIVQEFNKDRDRIPELDILTVQSSQARCESDLAEHHRLQRRRIELMPGSKFLQLWLATTLRERNLPAEALVTMQNINPDRDLGWLNERGRSFFWREIAAAQHMLGDFAAERETANRMRRAGGTALAYAYFTARSMAETNHPDSALMLLRSVKSAANDPALLSGLTSGRLNAVHLANPGWVMFETALELSRSGHDSTAATAATMAIDWFESNGALSSMSLEHQWLLAQCFLFTSRLNEAQSVATMLVKAHPDFVEFRGLGGVVAAHRRDLAGVAQAEHWLEAAKDVVPIGAPLLYRAEIAAVLGDSATSMHLIESLPHGVHPFDWIHFHIDPEFASLRTMPRFQRLLVPKG